ncbi:uncharacterized protein LOC144659980 isoform X2 [Oculina patagonica]
MLKYFDEAAGIVNMKNRHLGKDFKLRLVKYFLLCSLSLLMIQDASSSTDMKCEIKSSCSPSVCQQTNQMAVDPGSNITLNCSIITGELVQGMTWNQALERVKNRTGSPHLFLQRWNTKYSCQCTAVNFTRWPLPHIVHWHKDDKPLSNGTEDVYHSLQERGETLHSALHLPPGREEQEGLYKCSATNSIPGWSSSDSYEIQLIYECPSFKSPTISSPEVLARTFSNVSLTCWVDSDDLCPEHLFWRFNDNPSHLPESGEKYKVEVMETHTKCKKEFILSIFNVTENDEGTYSCHWECEYENTTKAAIDLKVFVPPPTEIPTTSEYRTLNQSNSILVSSTYSGTPRNGFMPIIILSALTGRCLIHIICLAC